ncbi:MAG TPA: peptidoglycan DD-metalloendopeptidase family protein [Candidatus Peribacteraceae bacterium]|nr:peptidoglycan DD-metalloendopeptidase family protein [Candidatus Peribacteraceae bacterium]
MPQIDIHIDRPWLTLALIGGAIALFVHFSSGTNAAPVGGDPSGGNQVNPVVAIHNAEADAEKQREKQQALARREDVLRMQLSTLEQQMQAGGDDQTMQELATARANLVSLLEDKQAAEKAITDSLQQIWDAEGIAEQASRNSNPNAVVHFVWPVAPLKGISAHFNDPQYVATFGVPHHAVDIPVPQGSIVGAAADGVVEKVSDQGMGFNSLIIRHSNGMTTLYGHVIKFLVKEGDTVHAGQPVALSGGTPGTPGAGPMTTGPHLHLAFYKNGKPVDPMQYLPSYPGVH